MMRIIKTNTIGFCYGVDRAVQKTQSLAADGSKRIVTWGELIHNPEMTEKLRGMGVVCTENFDDIKNEDTVVIRTHGVSKIIADRLAASCGNVVDMTCPNVMRIHDIASKSEVLVVAGSETHPEVKGTLGWCKGESFVAPNSNRLQEILNSLNGKAVTLVAQTTFSVETWNEMKAVAKNYPFVTVTDTICRSTEKRQSEVEELSQKVDFFIIVGGKNSSNTKKLYETAAKNCPAIHIENALGLPPNVNKYKNIGLSSGASTPKDMTEEVIYTMTNEIDTKNLIEEDIDFASALENTFKSVRNGQRVSGIVTAVSGTEVQVDIGVKYTGFIPTSEFANDDKAVAVGDEVEAFVVKVNDNEGTAVLSKKNLDNAKGLEKINAAFAGGEVLTGKVVDVVKGGVVVNYSGIRIFIPASQASLNRDADLESLRDQTIRYRIIEVEGLNTRRKRIIGSARAVLREEKQKKADEIWATLEVGKTYEGTVRSVVPFGAFVDIGGVDGLVHITDMTWKRIRNPKDIVSEGDKVTVAVKALDAEKKRISLTMKNENEDPWKKLHDTYEVGSELEVEVLKIMEYGAFVSVIPEVDGLVHISQISSKHVAKVEDALKVGQKVTARIIEIDDEAKRVSLSIKAVEEASAEETEAQAE